MPTPGVSGPPIFRPSAFSLSAATNLSKIGRCTYTRSVPRQTWPQFSKALRVMPATALSKSASANTMPAFLPPSSKLTGRTPLAAAAMMASPVRVSPVKVMPLTRGCLVMNSPAEPGPKPCSTWYTPFGMPTAFITSPSKVAVAGVSSEGLTMTVLPQASAGPTFQVISSSGRFQGQITPTTPSGERIA